VSCKLGIDASDWQCARICQIQWGQISRWTNPFKAVSTVVWEHAFVLRLNQPALDVEQDDDAPDEEKSSLPSDNNDSTSEPPHIGWSKLLAKFVNDDTILRRIFSGTKLGGSRGLQW